MKTEKNKAHLCGGKVKERCPDEGAGHRKEEGHDTTGSQYSSPGELCELTDRKQTLQAFHKLACETVGVHSAPETESQLGDIPFESHN